MKYQIMTGAPAAEMEEEMKNDQRLTIVGAGVGDSLIVETEQIDQICDDYCAIYTIAE